MNKPVSSNALLTVVAGSFVPAAMAGIQLGAGIPTPWRPLPFLVTLPMFMELPLAVLIAIPMLSYLALNLPLAFSGHPRGVPVQHLVVLMVATAFSLLWLGLGWPGGVEYQGRRYVLLVVATNAATLAALWTIWFRLRGRGTPFGVLAFATLLHIWLFGWAFPYFGELA
jgi:hypothetical protein